MSASCLLLFFFPVTKCSKKTSVSAHQAVSNETCQTHITYCHNEWHSGDPVGKTNTHIYHPSAHSWVNWTSDLGSVMCGLLPAAVECLSLDTHLNVYTCREIQTEKAQHLPTKQINKKEKKKIRLFHVCTQCSHSCEWSHLDRRPILSAPACDYTDNRGRCS